MSLNVVDTSVLGESRRRWMVGVMEVAIQRSEEKAEVLLVNNNVTSTQHKSLNQAR